MAIEGRFDRSLQLIISPELINRFNKNSLYQTLGLCLTSARDGNATSQLQPPETVCWPFPGQPHGGILFTQMDTTMAWAVLSLAGDGANCSTVNLEIQYPFPAKGSAFTCKTEVMHNTGRSCFVRGECRDKDSQLVAIAQGTFRIIRSDMPV